MRADTTLHQPHIYWVVDDDGNVLEDLGAYTHFGPMPTESVVTGLRSLASGYAP
jgi:hypothetical protein